MSLLHLVKVKVWRENSECGKQEQAVTWVQKAWNRVQRDLKLYVSINGCRITVDTTLNNVLKVYVAHRM